MEHKQKTDLRKKRMVETAWTGCGKKGNLDESNFWKTIHWKKEKKTARIREKNQKDTAVKFKRVGVDILGITSRRHFFSTSSKTSMCS